MFRLSKLTDYAIILLYALQNQAGGGVNALRLAERTGLPSPVVAKILKSLARANVIASKRGIGGGYSMARPSPQIPILDVIVALDGPLALTACVEGSVDHCQAEPLCPLRGRWEPVNQAVYAALQGVSLAAILGQAEPTCPPALTISPMTKHPALKDSARHHQSIGNTQRAETL